MSLITRRYATAIVDAASAANNLEAIAEDLSRFAEAFKVSDDLAIVLTNPMFNEGERKKSLSVVMTALKLSDLVRRFLELLDERRRMSELPDIAVAVRQLADERAKRVRADVQTATELSDEAKESLRRALEKRTGKQVSLDISVDPSLLGGIRAAIGSTVFDGTIRSQLEQLRDTLARVD